VKTGGSAACLAEKLSLSAAELMENLGTALRRTGKPRTFRKAGAKPRTPIR
jgi:hypothetical protein